MLRPADNTDPREERALCGTARDTAFHGSVFGEGRVRDLAEDGRRAYVWLIPGDGCQGCSNGGAAAGASAGAPRVEHGCKGACGRLFAPASGRAAVLLVENPVAAQPGQRVLLASRPGHRFLAIGVIFFFPLLVFFAAYALGTALFDGHELGAFGFAVAACAVYYLILYFLEKRRQKNTRPVWIERVL
jgi:positive regulator of sigma E activity